MSVQVEAVGVTVGTQMDRVETVKSDFQGECRVTGTMNRILSGSSQVAPECQWCSVSQNTLRATPGAQSDDNKEPMNGN
ncbi:hypothetical protein JRQ81_017268 [Phrynocephalus forsythii]|uniref:Uncharacterized protein n=1 Tax=Phrynocephalus forsythii TaxID=171643 RepID=A0A9Q0XR12_9SAUR|nr:hypothetical protein JRQ81_017268 [Phrynocephalus forsythii]